MLATSGIPQAAANARQRMPDASSSDPTAVWRDLVSQWEKNVNALANKTMATDEYASAQSTMMSGLLRMQQMMASSMSTYLATMNLPSRADVVAIGDRLSSIEALLTRIAATLEAQSVGGRPEASPIPRPPRTKQPPSSSE
jgi:hypothetical protein